MNVQSRPFLILLRGGPASGKTIVGRLIRDDLSQAISIPFNVFHRFLSRIPTQNKDLTFEAVLVLADFFLKNNFSVIIEEFFIFPERIDPFFELGGRYHIPAFLFELEVSLEDSIKRYDLQGIKVDKGEIQRIIDLISSHPEQRAQKIDTSKYSPQDIKDLILKFIGESDD